MAEQRGVAAAAAAATAAAGLCKALPQPRSHSASMEAQKHLRDSQPLLAEGLAIHSVVLLPQDTPRMAGLLWTTTTTSAAGMSICLHGEEGGRRGREERKRKREKNGVLVFDSNWQ